MQALRVFKNPTTIKEVSLAAKAIRKPLKCGLPLPIG